MLPSRGLFKLHRYAGLLTAPMILFFAVSGIVQVFRLHQDHKSGYKAPAVLKVTSDFHKVEGLRKDGRATAFRIAVTVAAGVLALAASLGIILGFRTTRPPWLAALLLTLGILAPLVLFLLAMKGAAN